MKRRLIYRILFAVTLTLLFFPINIGLGESAATIASLPATINVQYGDIEDFDLVTENSGWLLLNQNLFWSDDRGENWSLVTPTITALERISAVFFINNGMGWVLLNGINQPEVPYFKLARTTNHGISWEISELKLFSSGDIDASLQSAFLFFIDSLTGWLVVRSTSSSNFDNGVLFRTENGGLTWEKYEAPTGEPVYFINKDVGWMSGGTTGGDIYRSIDGGRTWQQPDTLPDIQQVGYPVQFQNPLFSTPQLGFLPVIVNDQKSSYLQILLSEDGGITWHAGDSSTSVSKIDPETRLPFSILGKGGAVVIDPATGQVISTSKNGALQHSTFQGPIPPSIIKLDMASRMTGWLERSHGDCGDQALNRTILTIPPVENCRAEDQLLLTQNGGVSWERLELPSITGAGAGSNGSLKTNPEVGNKPLAISSAAIGNRTRLVVGQGFDKCEIPTLDKLQEWIKNGPYDTVNLYIGGAARSCSNSALSTSYITQLSQQGWSFIPTWVGPQAACYSRSTAKMSVDPLIARQEGVSEANAAIDKAYTLGLTLADKSGAVIYYDLERYDMTNSQCHQAARAFIEGWSSQFRIRNNTPGLYSSGPILNDFFTLAQKPEAIWPAHWIASNYSSSATVWDVYYLSNNYWANHERLRQYAGGHSETWGTISITVDSNVIDGLVSLGPLEEDENKDGEADLYLIRKSGGQSGFTEIYTLNGKLSFSAIQSHFVTPLPYTNDQWDFDLADFDRDSIPDLYAFHHYATPSGKTEVSILSGSSGFQSNLLTVTTNLTTSLPGSRVYSIGNFDQDGIPDLYAIQRDNPGTVQVSVLSGNSGYQNIVANLLTALGSVGTNGGWYFTLGDYNQDHISDLAAINKSTGASSQTEITILNGADGFLTTLLSKSTALAKTGTDNGWVFFLRDHNNDGIPDLFAINKATGVQGFTELTVLDGATQFSTVSMFTLTGLPKTGTDCNWDFLNGQCYPSTPGTLFRIFFPLTYR